MTTTTPESGSTPAKATVPDDSDRWSQFLRRVFRSENLDGPEAALWIAVSRYAERPSKSREQALRQAARQFGVAPEGPDG